MNLKIIPCTHSLSYLMLKSQPIVLYGAAIWGIGQASRLIENLHLFAVKKLLGVGRRTPSDPVSAELGRYPIDINAHTCCVRYWLKLTRPGYQ